MRFKRTLLIGLGATALLLLFVSLWLAAGVRRLSLPPPGGPHAVGRLRLNWIDDQRYERLNPTSRREVIAEIWYPARPNTGSPCAYMPELPANSDGLVASGEITAIEAWGLARVRAHGRADAEFASVESACPVVILSPGNATNVEFYSAFAEELASQGYVVFGINHPYDVAAVRLHDGSVATYRERTFGDQKALTDRMQERAADVRFLVSKLPEVNAGKNVLAGHLDLARLGIMGHSLGGLTGCEVCTSDPQLLAACINLDGLHAGNPYGANTNAPAPTQPFLYLGKERTIGTRTQQLIDQNPAAELVKFADASHNSFQDGGLFEPVLNPLDGSAVQILDESRRAVTRFFDRHLKPAR